MDGRILNISKNTLLISLPRMGPRTFSTHKIEKMINHRSTRSLHHRWTVITNLDEEFFIRTEEEDLIGKVQTCMVYTEIRMDMQVLQMA